MAAGCLCNARLSHSVCFCIWDTCRQSGVYVVSTRGYVASFFLIKRLYGFESGVSTMPNFLLHSTCRDVSGQRDEVEPSFPFFFSTSVTVRGYCATSFRISSPASCVANAFRAEENVVSL